LNPRLQFYARDNYAEELARSAGAPGVFNKPFFGERFSIIWQPSRALRSFSSKSGGYCPTDVTIEDPKQTSGLIKPQRRLYMFVLRYATKWRIGRGTDAPKIATR